MSRHDEVPAGSGDTAIALRECRDVDIEGVTILEGGHFVVLATGCDRLRIRNVTVDTSRDGINLVACRDTEVRDSQIDCLRTVDGEPVGAAWLRRWPGEERGYGFVDETTPELSMSLLPAHRGRGLGTRLLRTLLSAAEARFAAVSLSVSQSNPARRLYEREGFVPVGKPEGGSIAMLRKTADL
jgi:GNAT superfamily N-acetyltransferase